MFKWYFQNNFIENSILFWISISVIITIILVTIFLVRKALRKENVNK